MKNKLFFLLSLLLKVIIIFFTLDIWFFDSILADELKESSDAENSKDKDKDSWWEKYKKPILVVACVATVFAAIYYVWHFVLPDPGDSSSSSSSGGSQSSGDSSSSSSGGSQSSSRSSSPEPITPSSPTSISTESSPTSIPTEPSSASLFPGSNTKTVLPDGNIRYQGSQYLGIVAFQIHACANELHQMTPTMVRAIFIEDGIRFLSKSDFIFLLNTLSSFNDELATNIWYDFHVSEKPKNFIWEF